MNYSSPQFMILAGGAVVFVLWYKGYLDGFLSQLGFGSSPGRPGSGKDLFLIAVEKAVAEAELAAHQAAADRFRAQIEQAVHSNFVAAGTTTPQAPPSPAVPSGSAGP